MKRVHPIYPGLLPTLLAACTPPASPGASPFAGTWTDPTAEFTTCGETCPTAISLDLDPQGTTVTGTFTLGDQILPFTGSVERDTLQGRVGASDGASLAADLVREEDELRGTFTAAEPVARTAGGESIGVYAVELRRE